MTLQRSRIARRFLTTAALATTAISIVGIGSAAAATTEWTGAADGVWTNADNWTAGVPTATDDVVLAADAAITGVPAGTTVASFAAQGAASLAAATPAVDEAAAPAADAAAAPAAPATFTVTGAFSASTITLEGLALALTDTSTTTVADGSTVEITGAATLAGALVIDEPTGAERPTAGGTQRVVGATSLTGAFSGVTRTTDGSSYPDGTYYSTKADADAASITAHDPFVAPTGGTFYPGSSTTVSFADFAPGEEVTVEVWIGRTAKAGVADGVLVTGSATADDQGIAKVELAIPANAPDSGPGTIYASGAESGVVAKYVTVFRPISVLAVNPAFDANGDGLIDVLTGDA